MTTPYLIEIWQGQHLYQEFAVKDSDGNAVDLTTATLSVQAHSALYGTDLTATKSGSADGIFYLSSPEADTNFAVTGTYPVQVWASWASGNPTNELLVELKVKIKERLA